MDTTTIVVITLVAGVGIYYYMQTNDQVGQISGGKGFLDKWSADATPLTMQ